MYCSVCCQVIGARQWATAVSMWNYTTVSCWVSVLMLPYHDLVMTLYVLTLCTAWCIPKLAQYCHNDVSFLQEIIFIQCSILCDYTCPALFSWINISSKLFWSHQLSCLTRVSIFKDVKGAGNWNFLYCKSLW